MSNKDIVQVAQIIAERVYFGERLRDVAGEVYYNNHIKPIVECLRDNDEKVLGFLHDDPEKAVSVENKKRKQTQCQLLSNVEEKNLIEARLESIVAEFRSYGIDLTRQSPIIEDLNVLTKRTSEKNDYMKYGRRIVNYARSTGRLTVIMVKKTDLLNNMDEDRNPGERAQSDTDKKRIENYKALLALLNKEFPDVQPRPFRKHKENRKEYKRVILTSSGREYKQNRSGGRHGRNRNKGLDLD